MTDQVLNRSSERTALQKLQEEVSQLKKEKFESDKQRQKEMASQEVQSYVSELKSVVDDSEQYPLVTSFWDEAQQSILDIQKHYAMNGNEPLTNEEVLEQVENTYREFMDKAVQNEKVRSIYKIGSPSEKAEQGEVQKSQSRTLSSKGTSRLRTSETKTGPLSKHEALERAVNVYRESRSGV
jgi:glycosylphosphatidylinositol transamidase (GPIT) subunit GPI8